MAYIRENVDACTIKAVIASATTIFAGLVGPNYKRTGESDTTNGLIAPLSGQRGYGMGVIRGSTEECIDLTKVLIIDVPKIPVFVRIG